MTNCSELAEELGRRCNGHHSHQQLIGGRSKEAGQYPTGLCQAICKGLIRAMWQERMSIRHLMTVSKEDTIGADTRKEKGVNHVEDEER